MVQIDENFVNDWIYQIMSKLEDPAAVRDELLKLSAFIINAPGASQSKGQLPKTRIR